MNVKVLFVLFLCLSMISVAYAVVMKTFNEPCVSGPMSQEVNSMNQLILGGNEMAPEGDPRFGGGLP